MKRLVPGLALAGLIVTFAPAPMAAAASNTATTLFPVDDTTQIETHSFVDCHGNGSCDFVAGANLRTPDGPAGFPPKSVGAANHRDPVQQPGGLPRCARHQPVRAGDEVGWD